MTHWMICSRLAVLDGECSDPCSHVTVGHWELSCSPLGRNRDGVAPWLELVRLGEVIKRQPVVSLHDDAPDPGMAAVRQI